MSSRHCGPTCMFKQIWECGSMGEDKKNLWSLMRKGKPRQTEMQVTKQKASCFLRPR